MVFVKMCFSPLGSWPQYSSKVNVKGGNGDCKVVILVVSVHLKVIIRVSKYTITFRYKKIEILTFLKSML